MASVVSAFETMAASEVRVLIVGDPILDRYTWGNVKRTSPEAPVLVLHVDQRETRLGGAASLAYLASGLGAATALLGVVGEDAAGCELLELATQCDIDVSGVLTDIRRRTTVKERFIGRAATRHPQQVLRVDDEVTPPLSEALQTKLLQIAQRQLPDCQAVLISDYNKGTCGRELIQGVIAAANARQIPVIVDPAAISDYRAYHGATLVTPNRSEAQLATGMNIDSPHDAKAAARRLCEEHSLQAAVITLDRDGMVLVDCHGVGGGRQETEEVFPTEARDVYDITGAGDMVMAMIGRSLAAGLTLPDAIRLANVAAGLEVERVGVLRVSLEEIRQRLLGRRRLAADKLVTLNELAAIVAQHRQRGRRIVFTNGCFDVVHFGHTSYLEEAATLGDVLVVGLNSDASIRQLRGDGRPVHSQAQRAGVLGALSCVDYVVVFDQLTPHAALEQIRPDVLVKGGDYTSDAVVGRELVESYGGRVCVTRKIEDCSTTQVLRALEK